MGVKGAQSEPQWQCKEWPGLGEVTGNNPTPSSGVSAAEGSRAGSVFRKERRPEGEIRVLKLL